MTCRRQRLTPKNRFWVHLTREQWSDTRRWAVPSNVNSYYTDFLWRQHVVFSKIILIFCKTMRSITKEVNLVCWFLFYFIIKKVTLQIFVCVNYQTTQQCDLFNNKQVAHISFTYLKIFFSVDSATTVKRISVSMSPLG